MTTDYSISQTIVSAACTAFLGERINVLFFSNIVLRIYFLHPVLSMDEAVGMQEGVGHAWVRCGWIGRVNDGCCGFATVGGAGLAAGSCKSLSGLIRPMVQKTSVASQSKDVCVHAYAPSGASCMQASKVPVS
jgi:hypothetical protein